MTFPSRTTRRRRRLVVRGTLLIALALVGCNTLSGADSLVVRPATELDAGDTYVPPVDTGPGDEPIVDTGVPDTAEEVAPPLPPKHVFVTSDGGLTGDLGGRAGADEICRVAAGNIVPNAHWIAWLSVATPTSESAYHRIQHPGAYVLLDDAGTPVVSDKAQLVSGHLLHAINVTEQRAALTDENRGVWTGTTADGGIDQTCADWSWDTTPTTVTDPVGTLGSANATDEAWTKGAGGGVGPSPDSWSCAVPVSIYCFEQ